MVIVGAGVGLSVGVLVDEADGDGSSDPPVQAAANPTIIAMKTTINVFCKFLYLGFKAIWELPILQTGPSGKKFPASATRRQGEK